MGRFLTVLVLAVAAGLAAAGAARAHPHILIDARTELAFDDNGKVRAVRHVWQFDESFTEVAIEGLDTDGDGKISDQELLPLAELNMTSLAEYGFFTRLLSGATALALAPPEEYWLEFVDGRLTLFFSLPLATPAPVGPGLMLEVGDPEYFVAFLYPGDAGVTLVDAPAGCHATFHPPGELDPQTAAALAAIPAGERQLPSIFGAVTDTLDSFTTVDCH